MSDAEHPDRERLDWGEETPETVRAAEPAGERDTADAESAPMDDGDEGALCRVEDPTCDACQ